MTTDPDRLVVVGKVVKPHGIQGEVVVEIHCDSPGVFEIGRSVSLLHPEHGPLDLHIKGLRYHQGRALIRFQEVGDRNEAEDLRDFDLYIHRENLKSAAPGEFYVYEILDATVLDTTGRWIGRVESVNDSGAHYLLTIRTPETSFMVPFVDTYIQQVCRERGEIVLQNYAGLLALEQS